MNNFLIRYYFPDLRSLALMRIGIALVVICDLLIRFGDIPIFYSDEGIWPVKIMYNLGWQPGFWSLHAISGNSGWALIIFCIHLLFAFFLLIGYHCRISTLVVWLLYISLHNRNLFVLQSGDDLLRMTLMWGFFLPWGSRFSIDAFKNKPLPMTAPMAYFAYLLLLASVYLFTVLLKTDKEWHSEASAMYYALSLEQLRLPGLGDFIYRFPVLLKFLTPTVYYTELLLPFLILWPSESGKSRGWAFLLILILHLGIGLSLFVGLFFWISIASALALIPGSFLNRLSQRLHWLKPQEGKDLLSGSPLHYLRSSLIVLLSGLCLFINFSSLDWFPFQPSKEVRLVNNFIRLNQYWGMFSPGILKKDGWLVYHGVDSLGRQWDLRMNRDYVDYSKPKRITAMYPNDRWRKLAENMQNEKFMFLRHLYGNYYLKRWNQKHPERRMKTLNLYFMEQESLADYQETRPKKILYAVSTEP